MQGLRLQLISAYKPMSFCGAGLEVSHTYKRLVESCGLDVLLFADADIDGGTASQGKQEVLSARTGLHQSTQVEVTLARAAATATRARPGARANAATQPLLHDDSGSVSS